jgi:two-component sensor histidine kinase
MSPVCEDGRIVAILQVAQDVTQSVLAERLADTHQRASRVAADIGHFSYDPETGQFVRSEEVDRLFGFAPDEAGPLAAPFFDRVAAEQVDAVNAEVGRIMAAPRGEIACFDYRIDHPDGVARHVRVRAEIATDPHDRRPRLVDTFVDMTDMEQHRQKLEALLEMKEALLTEANHRIKNSLQMALSMLRLEAAQLKRDTNADAATAVAAMEVAESRIRSVATIHGMMRLNDNVEMVDLDTLLADLVAGTRDAVGLAPDEITLDGPGYRDCVDSDTAIIFGLVVNELLTNAIKHGGSSTEGPRVRVWHGFDARGAVLAVENDVHASAPGPIQAGSSSLGKTLVARFVEQIGGAIERMQDGSTYRATLSFPV